MDFTGKGTIGVVLMIVGTLAFVPGIFPTATGLMYDLLLVPAIGMLTLGTYLYGTDTDGKPV
jgi:hypothetical protein